MKRARRTTGGGGSAGAGTGGAGAGSGSAGAGAGDAKRSRWCLLADGTVPAAQALSEDQRQVLDLVNARNHVFLTGCAGSGKTQTAMALIDAMVAAGTSFANTASTGVAAQLFGGVTLHSALSMWTRDSATEKEDVVKVKQLRSQGLDKEAERQEESLAYTAASSAIRRLTNSRSKKAVAAKNRLLALEVLVVDEISMISAHTLLTAMFILKSVRSTVPGKAPMPVMVLIGDFLQLLPVCGEPALESFAWRQLGPVPVVLTKSFRQMGDTSFLDVLNDVRMGKVTTETLALLRAREAAPLPDDADPTCLLAYKADVDRANDAHLRGLAGDAVTFQAQVFIGMRCRTMAPDWDPVPGSVALSPASTNPFLKDVDVRVPGAASAGRVEDLMLPEAATLVQTALARTPAVLALKVGAHVMFTSGFMAVKEMEAGTVVPDAGAGAGAGAGTAAEPLTAADVAASMVRIVNGTRGVVVAFAPWPVVRLDSGDVVTARPAARVQTLDGVEELVSAATMGKPASCPLRQREKLMTEGPALVCKQVPLMLAKAITIHKSQGLTMQGKTMVSMNVFAEGQAYVAMSRFKQWDDLHITALDPSKITANAFIVDWYRTHAAALATAVAEADDAAWACAARCH
jgi:ATP-dependent DNA helicase PIF1